MTKVDPTARIDSGAEIGEGADIGPYCVVGPNVKLGDGCKLMSHVVLDGHTTLGAECEVFPFASIGTRTQDLKFQGGVSYVEIGDRTTLREYVTVNSGTNEGETTRVGSGCLLMAYSHVAHGCDVGNGVIMANCASLAGVVRVEDYAVLGGIIGVHQFVRIGTLAMVGGLSRIVKDCPPFMTVEGNPAKTRGLNLVGLQRKGVPAGTIAALKKAYRILFRSDMTTAEAVKRIRSDIEALPEIERLASFVEQSERGLAR